MCHLELILYVDATASRDPKIVWQKPLVGPPDLGKPKEGNREAEEERRDEGEEE